MQTEVLYQTAISFAGLTGKETIVDAYCGIGTIGIIASDHCKRVIGVESNSDAVRDARKNIKANQANHVEIYGNDAGAFLVDLAEKKKKIDVVFLDPPRAGSDEPFLRSVLMLAPKRVVYISCNPETQARDLKILTNGRYRVEKIQPVDMFPGSEHVESICLLERMRNRKVGTKVRLDINLEDYYRIKDAKAGN